MLFDGDAAALFVKLLKDRPALKVALDKVRRGDVIDPEAAVELATAIKLKDPTYSAESICEYLGHAAALSRVEEVSGKKRAEEEAAEKQRLADMAAKIKLRMQKEEDRKRKLAEAEEKKERRIKAANEKAAALQRDKEKHSKKRVFTVKGSDVDEITTIIPEVCEWLSKRDDIYVCGGMLSRWSESKEGMLIVSAESLAALIGVGFSFKSVRHTADAGPVDEYMTQCPQDIRATIIATEYFHGIRECNAILDRPVVMRTGEVIGKESGYHAGTGLLFNDIPKIQDVPLDQAYRAIFDVFSEFPPCAVPGALALLFTEVMRPCLPTAPMVFINAPALSSGKSLLAKSCLHIINNHRPASVAQPKTEEEFDKQIKTLLERYPGRTLFLDDFAGHIDYQLLKTILTEAETFEFRILGLARSYKAKTNFTVVMTGNNASFGEEMKRRSIVVEVDTGEEHPAQRVTRRNSEELLQFIQNNRAYLLSCVITILTDALANMGEEHKTRRMGSFEVWADTVGCATVYCSNKLVGMDLLPSGLNHDLTPDMQAHAEKTDDAGEVFAKLYEEKRNTTWTFRDLSKEVLFRVNDLLGTIDDKHTTRVRVARLGKYMGRPRSFGGASYKLTSDSNGRFKVDLVKGTPDLVDPVPASVTGFGSDLPAHADRRNLESN